MIWLALLAASAPPLTPAQADEIVRECNIPRKWLRSRNGIAEFRAPDTARPEQVFCVAKRVNRDAPPLKGRIGAPVPSRP